jgi:hypothetical protein
MLRWGLGNHGGYQDRYGAEFADIDGGEWQCCRAASLLAAAAV